MGIPKYYKTLTLKYPKMVEDEYEVKPVQVENGAAMLSKLDVVQTSCKSSEKRKVHNLYIDINCILNSVFQHMYQTTTPNDYDELFRHILNFIDILFGIVLPENLLYLAVDGVPPRAKMNHQRCKRYRQAKYKAEAIVKARQVQQEAERKARNLHLKHNVKVWTTSAGCELSVALTKALQYYIHDRLNNDPQWNFITVILSDANIPGEAEHKIMQYIRLQRNCHGYNPNTCHCVYGADADLAMLALITHEVHFSILREVSHSVKDCNATTASAVRQPYKLQLLNISTLREYLELEMQICIPFLNFENFLDDYVLICMLVGNDFLPPIPTLVIEEGALELLIDVYKEVFASMGGYLTDSGEINQTRFEIFIQAVGVKENEIIQKRAQQSKVSRYLEGLCWNMHYYYSGVCSWQWFYPYYRGPLACDLKNFDKQEISFIPGCPMRPLTHLVMVLHPSNRALPEPYRKLMTDLLEFYPKDFELDMDGKKYDDQGIAILPFIDEDRIRVEIEKVEPTLREEELQRNTVTFDMLFVAQSHPLSSFISSLNDNHERPLNSEQAKIKKELDPFNSHGLNGYLLPCSPISLRPVKGMENLMNNTVRCAVYELPDMHKHVSRLLEGVTLPKKIVQIEDLKPAPVLGHDTGKNLRGTKECFKNWCTSLLDCVPFDVNRANCCQTIGDVVEDAVEESADAYTEAWERHNKKSARKDKGKTNCYAFHHHQKQKKPPHG